MTAEVLLSSKTQTGTENHVLNYHTFSWQWYIASLCTISLTEWNNTRLHIINSTPTKSVFLHFYPKPWWHTPVINAKSIGEHGWWVWFFEGMNFFQLLHQIFLGHLLGVPVFIHVPETLTHTITMCPNTQNNRNHKSGILTTDSIILDINKS